MLIIKHTVTTTASPKAIWAIWKDAANWPTWDTELETVILNGPFTKGATGRLKPKGGPWVNLIFADVITEKSFLTFSNLPLTTIFDDHYIQVKNGLTHVTNVIEMKGLLAFFFALVIGRNMKKTLPHTMENLVKQAERNSL
jgi:hypothetical protein